MIFMIMVQYSHNRAPITYFFSDAPTANRFYYMKKRVCEDLEYLKDTKIGLWRMSDSGTSYELKLSNY